MTGLASGLVETMREIAGAVGVAAVSTVLVSRAGVNAFHAAFWVIFAVAALGALTAAIGFPRRTTQEIDPEPGSVQRFDRPGTDPAGDEGFRVGGWSA